MTIGSLFTGIGGLELGLEMCGLGPVIWQCDSDPCARAVLEQHWPGVKRYSDVREVDGRAERPSIICGGFPCQPVSVAGKRKAQADTRWLWPFFAAVIHAVRPAVVFIENVPGLRTAGLRDVLADLAALGLDAEWDLFSAAETGAPHRRLRLFLLAYADGAILRQQSGRSGRAGRCSAAQPGQHGTHGAVANAHGVPGEEGRQGYAPQGERGQDADRSGVGADMADADRLEGDLRPAARSGDAATSDGGWWAAEPDVGRVADGVPARAHRLRLLGNACVPAQAALAWRTLSARINKPLCQNEP